MKKINWLLIILITAVIVLLLFLAYINGRENPICKTCKTCDSEPQNYIKITTEEYNKINLFMSQLIHKNEFSYELLMNHENKYVYYRGNIKDGYNNGTKYIDDSSIKYTISLSENVGQDSTFYTIFSEIDSSLLNPSIWENYIKKYIDCSSSNYCKLNFGQFNRYKNIYYSNDYFKVTISENDVNYIIIFKNV